ncbi:MAG: hypothetical protein WCL04_04075 [Verrucomicrobiota bacterium]
MLTAPGSGGRIIGPWQQRWRQGGVATLRSRGAAGPKPKLSAGQREGLAVALVEGPQAHGYVTAVWTLPRVPAYAPDLNPVEMLWGNVKDRELANLCAPNLGVTAQVGPPGPAARRAPPHARPLLLCPRGPHFVIYCHSIMRGSVIE